MHSIIPNYAAFRFLHCEIRNGMTKIHVITRRILSVQCYDEGICRPWDVQAVCFMLSNEGV